MKYFAVGVKTKSLTGETLDAKYVKVSNKKIQYNKNVNIIRVPDFLPVKREIFDISIDISKKITSVEDAYLRLHLLSTLKQKPNTINLDNIFNIMPTNVFTNFGPIEPQKINQLQLQNVPIVIQNIDKFPFLLNYIIPKNVRIASISCARLGAYLSEGTVIMPSGFVNYNAGTLGKSMIEGRVSQGVVVEDGSDIGGGASIMGTLSGGGKEKIKIGKNCLIGANGGTGISLGDNSTIAAGLYITAGTKVFYKDKTVKAIELSGKGNILFLHNSSTGKVEAIDKKNKIFLNKDLHN
jgi:2,3,4,5-tetrahydropyridine-2-carboxylate N-succinyltransferase